MNLGLGTSAGIGERKSEVSSHRDVTNESVRETQTKVNERILVRHAFVIVLI